MAKVNISLTIVARGPVATAGSKFSFLKINGDMVAIITDDIILKNMERNIIAPNNGFDRVINAMSPAKSPDTRAIIAATFISRII